MIKTLQQAVADRHAKHAEFNARVDKRVAHEVNVTNLLKINPSVGVLTRNGKPVYYTYAAGGVYREAAKIETLIGSAK